MTSIWRQWLEHCLAGWMTIVYRYRIAVLSLTVISLVFCAYYTVNHIGMNTDTRDMLSPELRWRQIDLQIDEHFPQYTDNILVVIEAPTPDQARDTADQLTTQLQTENKLFKSVYYPGGTDFFKTNALLYLDTDELQDLADQLAAIQPFLGRLINDQSIRGLFNMLDEAVIAVRDGEDIDLVPLLKRINTILTARLAGESKVLSWQALMGGDVVEKPIYREFIVLQPVLDYGGLLPARPAMKKLRTLAAEIHDSSSNTVKVRLTGSAALSYEEMVSVSKGTFFSSIASTILVTVILLIGLRSIRLTLVSFCTLVAGLIYTAGFAAASVGELNLISIAFAVLYIGLGADFAIHFCLRYRELIGQHQEHVESLRRTAADTGLSLVLCAGTTALGFFAFIPTDYDGVAELGLISGTGMIISLLITLTLLPALLSLRPLQAANLRRFGKDSSLLIRARQIPYQHAGKVIVVSIILTGIALLAMTRLEFDHNTLNLHPQNNGSVKTYRDLLAESDTSPWTCLLLAKGMDQANILERKLESLPLVSKVVWIEDLIPADQDNKLMIIEEMDLLLGPLELTTGIPPGTAIEQAAALRSFLTSLSALPETMPDYHVYQQTSRTLAEYLRVLSTQNEAEQALSLQQLDHDLLSTFPGRLNALLTSLGAESFDLKTMPAELRDRWVSDDYYRLEIYPRENLMDNAAMRDFVTELRGVDPDVSGSPVINIEAGDAVVGAFKQAFIYALLATCLLLLLLTDRRIDTIYILVPLLLAALFTGAISVMLHMPLNFANIIALPLLLAIGMDSGIHILNRARNASPADGELLSSSSARAVIFSALTTIASIGNLALSPHPGTASMGKVLTIGLIMTLICTLILLPSLLAKDLRRQNS